MLAGVLAKSARKNRGHWLGCWHKCWQAETKRVASTSGQHPPTFARTSPSTPARTRDFNVNLFLTVSSHYQTISWETTAISRHLRDNEQTMIRQWTDNWASPKRSFCKRGVLPLWFHESVRWGGASDTRSMSGSVLLGSIYKSTEEGEAMKTMTTMNLHRLHRFMVAEPPSRQHPPFGAPEQLLEWFITDS